MTENTAEHETRERPRLWLIDSGQAHLAGCAGAFLPWADCEGFVWNEREPDWDNPPDAVFFSAEIPGGAQGTFFTALVDGAGPVPLIAVTRVRSLAQALAYFRAGAADYLPLPLVEEEARERFEASQERAARLAVQNMIVEIEQPTADRGEADREERHEEDILAKVPSPPSSQPAAWEDSVAFVNEMPLAISPRKTEAEQGNADDEPIPVDSLPIPTLWEELPCGLLLFDSLSNLVFSNRLALELLGHNTLAELQDALENNPASFAAHGANHKPFPDNQWPHLLAAKTRTPRSAVLSIEQRDKRRAWIRIDCQPHLADGTLARLSMTLVNLTGELPPLQPRESEQPHASAPSRKEKKDRAKRRGGKKN